MTMTAGETRAPWYRIAASSTNASVTEIQLYDDIGMWGVTAADFAQELKAVATGQITLHISSTGGNVFQGITIFNALRNHPAKVTVMVDGLAASIASVIAMAGDEVVMSRGSQMMIHNASGTGVGDAKTMLSLGKVLLKQNDNIASIYADRAGGTAAEWLAAMESETWYLADEAVAAGLADRVDAASQAEDIAAKFDLSIFNHAGRSDAPNPYMPVRPQTPVVPKAEMPAEMHRMHNAAIAAANTPKEGDDMQFSDEQLATLRNKLGLADDATLEPSQVLAAIADVAPQDQGGTTPPVSTQDTTTTPAPKAAGTMTIDASAWEEREGRIKALEASAAKHAREERDQVIDAAVRDGKFAPARKEHWARLWDADPEGTREVLSGLAKNVINMQEMGLSEMDGDALDDEFRHLFPPTATKGN